MYVMCYGSQKKLCERKKALQIKSTIIITICFITAHGEITAHGIAKVNAQEQVAMGQNLGYRICIVFVVEEHP